MDCGLCALKNVTVDRDINGNAAFDVALALQSELEAQELQSGASERQGHRAQERLCPLPTRT